MVELDGALGRPRRAAVGRPRQRWWGDLVRDVQGTTAALLRTRSVFVARAMAHLLLPNLTPRRLGAAC